MSQSMQDNLKTKMESLREDKLVYLLFSGDIYAVHIEGGQFSLRSNNNNNSPHPSPIIDINRVIELINKDYMAMIEKRVESPESQLDKEIARL